MSPKDSERQDPFEGEPVRDLDLVRPERPRPRKALRDRPAYPSESKRRSRQLALTFSDPAIPRRLRALAKKWDSKVSAVVEYLLLPRLEAAEKGEVGQDFGADAQEEPS